MGARICLQIASLIIIPNHFGKSSGFLTFFRDFCNKFVNESEDDAKWNYDEYFIDAFNNLKEPYDYFGI
jgi:hypothetical protein